VMAALAPPSPPPPQATKAAPAAAKPAHRVIKEKTRMVSTS
jgi:hypothetical protein